MENVVREKDPHLYLDDGDVVLQAKLANPALGKPQYRLYRVHKATLSLNSPVFSNLFADASASTGQQYDGVPLLEMSDDTGDLSQYLSYIYNPSHYLLRSSHPDTAFELNGAATLAGKYLLDGARADMIKRVVMDWPTTLPDWIVSEARLEVLDRTPSISRDDRTPEPMSAIVFAQTHGCTEILPAAFYRLASIDFDDDWGDVRRRGTGTSARWALCDRENVFRWLRGRKALENYHHRVVSALRYASMIDPYRRTCTPSWFHDPCDPEEPAKTSEEEDVKKHPCLGFLRTLCDNVWGASPTYDPLCALMRLEDHLRDSQRLKKTPPDGLCGECQNEFYDWLGRQREYLWSQLPRFFALQ